MTTVEVQATAMAVGGEAVAREASGRVVFVAGALPGERVRAELADEKTRFARGTVVEVLEPSPDRVAPPCPHVAEGCGGCDWQHVAVAAQRALRAELVRDVLARQAGIADPVVVGVGDLPAEGIRTTVRGVGDEDGRFAFRRRRSHDPIAAAGCLVAHPQLVALIDDLRVAPGREVVLRIGARTGEAIAVVGPDADGTVAPDGLVVVGRDQLRAGHRAWIHEEAAGRRWRISAESFFQASPEGAEALVAEVARAIAAHAPDATRLVDLCCGVGLFAGALGADGRFESVIGVERSATAVADARHNLADLDARTIKVALARWRPSPADVVVADPARSGLAEVGARAVAGTGARLCVLVSCDPASLGRDASLLAGHGYRHVGSSVVDLFGHASHVEVVSTFILA
ncbi:MAG: TRAM domain-containing protein [Acidimicrobiales bacterium]